METKTETAETRCEKCDKPIFFEIQTLIFKGSLKGKTVKCENTPKLCKPCEEQERKEWDIYRKEEQKKEEQEREAAWMREVDFKTRKIIPPRYLDTCLDHPDFNHDLHNEIANWEPCAEKPWLGDTGESGACKTRCLVHRMQREIEIGKKCCFVHGYELGKWASRQYFNDRSDEYQMKIQETENADFLLLDDVGKLGTTEAVAKVLHSILETRLCQNLPLLWSANLPLEKTFAKFPLEYRDPIIGRLLDGSVIFEV